MEEGRGKIRPKRITYPDNNMQRHHNASDVRNSFLLSHRHFTNNLEKIYNLKSNYLTSGVLSSRTTLEPENIHDRIFADATTAASLKKWVTLCIIRFP